MTADVTHPLASRPVVLRLLDVFLKIASIDAPSTRRQLKYRMHISAFLGVGRFDNGRLLHNYDRGMMAFAFLLLDIN